MTARGVRTLVILLVSLAVLAAAAWGASQLWDKVSAKFSSTGCTVGGYSLDTDQASVAAAMVGEVSMFRVHLPERASVLVLAAGLQESKLTNLAPGDGDRDSVGVLQQRPSQGWGNGKAKVLTNVTEATREFLEALIDVPHWRTRPLAVAVQKVQISADGSLYAQHEPEAQALADAFSGKKAMGVSCSFSAPTVVAPAHTVATQVSYELGIDTPKAQGRKVVVSGAGWQTVAWFVANADRLGIDSVAYSGHLWTRADGWKPMPTPPGKVVATMATLSKS